MYTVYMHKPHAELSNSLQSASVVVTVGGIYQHHKGDDYLVEGLGFLEATDEICVIYHNQNIPELTYIRPLTSWLEIVSVDDKSMPRFALIKAML